MTLEFMPIDDEKKKEMLEYCEQEGMTAAARGNWGRCVLWAQTWFDLQYPETCNQAQEVFEKYSASGQSDQVNHVQV
jgi:hypothetical protein